jgi:hypothetical protein
MSQSSSLSSQGPEPDSQPTAFATAEVRHTQPAAGTLNKPLAGSYIPGMAAAAVLDPCILAAEDSG